MIHGTLDAGIPIAHGDDLFREASEPKTFVRIQGAGHTGDPKLTAAPQYSQALTTFLKQL